MVRKSTDNLDCGNGDPKIRAASREDQRCPTGHDNRIICCRIQLDMDQGDADGGLWSRTSIGLRLVEDRWARDGPYTSDGLIQRCSLISSEGRSELRGGARDKVQSIK